MCGGMLMLSSSYNHTLLKPLGCKVIIHKKTGNRHSWDFRGKHGWNVGVSLKHYCCQLVVAKYTTAVQVSDTIEFRHHYLTQPSVTPEDIILHGMDTLPCNLEDAPTAACYAQLSVIADLHDLFHCWSSPAQDSPPLPPATMLHKRSKWI